VGIGTNMHERTKITGAKFKDYHYVIQNTNQVCVAPVPAPFLLSSNNDEILTEPLEPNHSSFEKSLEITYLEQYWKNGRNRYPANRRNATVAMPEQRGIAGHNNKNMI
jgi:hypothetical protein